MKFRESRVKIVLVGNRGVGKTCLARRFARGTFEKIHAPKLLNTAEYFTTKFRLGDKTMQVQITVTLGDPNFDLWRPEYYRKVDMALICFSLEPPNNCAGELFSYWQVEEKWYPEFKKNGNSAKFALVGLKSDLKPKSDDDPSLSERMLFAEKFGAEFYWECSALAYDNVEELFRKIAELYQAGKTEKKLCTIL